MKRPLAIIATALLLIGSSSCGGKKPPEPEALLGKKIITAIHELAQAYEKKDVGNFMGRIAKTFPDRNPLEQTLKGVFSKYDTIHFSFHDTKMLVMVQDRGNISAAVNWDGEWRSSAGDFVKDGGRITLLLEPGTLLFVGIEGKNPFIPQVTPMKQ